MEKKKEKEFKRVHVGQRTISNFGTVFKRGCATLSTYRDLKVSLKLAGDKTHEWLIDKMSHCCKRS